MKPYVGIEVIREMIIKSHEKLKTAQINLEHERHDDSVSRSYYAVYRAISAVLFSRGLHFSSHAQTIGTFNKELIKTKVFPASFTKTIEKLFNERQIGDYDFETHLDAEVAQEDLTEAKKIIEACEEYLAKTYSVSKEYWKR